MTIRSLSVAQIKATLAEQIRSAEFGEPVIITRHGKAVAAIVGADDLETLERLRASGPQGGLASIAGGWKGSEDLVNFLSTSRRLGNRTSPSLD